MSKCKTTALAIALVLLFLAVFSAGCQSAIETPRLATAEARSAQPVRATVEPLSLPAPTATGAPAQHAVAETMSAPAMSVWINETSQEHRTALNSMADDFNERTGIEVALQFVSPAVLPQLAQTAVLSDTLPDIILHPLEFSVSWSEDGILDRSAADEAINLLGRETFDEGALNLVNTNGESAAVPSDGYQQLWLYRSDWFEEAGLNPPDNYGDMQAAAETLFDPDNLIFGLVIPTESNLINTHRAFEHLALANGCQLFNENGEILILEPQCRDALDYYYSIVNQYSPPGVQTDTSARNAFLDGRAAMIMSDPRIFTELVQTNRLDGKTGIVTRLNGDNETETGANFANITNLGITPVADKEAAMAFIDYWFDEGYQTWLAVESERKVPMRLGTPDRPRFYIDAWGSSPVLQGESLSDIFGPQIVAQLRDVTGTTERWGFSQGQGELMGHIYDKLTFSIVLQEMLSGYFNSSKTLFEAYNRVIDLIPDYAFPVAPTPEA